MSVINKILGSDISAPVQPLVWPDKDCDFDDVKITYRLEAIYFLRTHVDKSDFNDAWANTVDQHVQQTICENSQNDSEAYNCDITKDETLSVLKSLWDKTCPGLD